MMSAILALLIWGAFVCVMLAWRQRQLTKNLSCLDSFILAGSAQAMNTTDVMAHCGGALVDYSLSPNLPRAINLRNGESGYICLLYSVKERVFVNVHTEVHPGPYASNQIYVRRSAGGFIVAADNPTIVLEDSLPYSAKAGLLIPVIGTLELTP